MVFSVLTRPGWRAGRGVPGMTLALVGGLLAGCSGFGGTGESEFACPGHPKGVSCKSPIEVYEATNGPGDGLSAGGGGGVAGRPAAGAGAGTLTTPLVVQRNLIVAPPNPKPILEEAQVMRIWMAPFVDSNQDLQWPGYTYTEITPRRWAFGEVEVEQIRQTAPLQVAATPQLPAAALAAPRSQREYTVGRPRPDAAPAAPEEPQPLGPAYMRQQAPNLDERAYQRPVDDLVNAN